MKKLALTTAVALVLATAAYAQDHMRGGGAPSANFGALHGPSGAGGPGPGNSSAPRGPSGPSAVGASNMGPSNTGPSNVRSQTMSSPKTGGPQFNNRFSERNQLNDR